MKHNRKVQKCAQGGGTRYLFETIQRNGNMILLNAGIKNKEWPTFQHRGCHKLTSHDGTFWVLSQNSLCDFLFHLASERLHDGFILRDCPAVSCMFEISLIRTDNRGFENI